MTKGRIEKRGSKQRRTRPVILIVTEGEKSEPKYFAHFRTRHNNIDIHIVPNSKNGGKTDYKHLIRKAAKIREDDDLSVDNGDSIWIIADGDVNYQVPDAVVSKNKALAHARNAADKEGLSLLISNPCFEIWYLLHRRYTTAFFPDYDSVKDALSHAGIVDYEKNIDIFDQLESDIPNAIENAQRLEKHHKDDGHSLPLSLMANPFTEVYRLVKALSD